MDDSTLTRPAVRSEGRVEGTSIHVRVVEGPDAGLSRIVASRRAVLGRSEAAEVRLTDATVSLFHVELCSSARGVEVKDLGSRNGTRMGEALVDHITAPSGCTLVLGSTTVRIDRVEHGDAQGEDGGTREAHPERGPPEAHGGSFGALVGHSRLMHELFSLLERLAPTDLSLLLDGPTGSGKELAARAIHAASRRASGPFVVLDCAALPEPLAASVLFGHEKGAFTGAVSRREGVFEAADQGTLFLDEVGELSASLQPMLLRALERREVTPVGKTTARPVDVRVLCATWRDLRAMVNAGSFREDLFYRLARATVRMPALAERPEDIPFLVDHFLRGIPKELTAARSITKEALDRLASADYPGNARQLLNVVERLAFLAQGPMITPADVAFDHLLANARERPSVDRVPASSSSTSSGAAPAAGGGSGVEPFKEAKRTLIDEFERTYLAKLLERAGDNVSRASAIAGLQRHNLRELLRKHGLRTRE